MSHKSFNYCFLLFLCCLFFLSGQVLAQNTIGELEQMLEQYSAEGNKIKLADTYNKLGKTYWNNGNLEQSIKSYENSLSLNKDLGNKNAQRIITGYLGLVNMEKENYNEAIKHFQSSLKFNLHSNRTQEIISDYYNIATCYQLSGNLNESNNYAEKALSKSLEINNMESAKSCNLMLAENYEKMGKAKESSKYFSDYNAIIKLLQQEQLIQLEEEKKNIATQISQISTKVTQKEKELASIKDTLGEVLQENREFQLQQQIAEIKLKEEQARSEAKDKLRKTQLMYSAIALVLILAVLFLFLIQSRQRKFANRKLLLQNQKIENQKLEIERQRDLADKQRKNLTSSIQYARRIQSAVVPRETELFKHFRDSFIFYKPKDIVSGDFYWFAKKDNLFVIAAADCTGHGVPGAFMSMLGVAYLNEIVNKIVINIHINALNADEILNQLRERVISSLHQSENKRDPKDGMDIALCIIDIEKGTLQYAGAYNPLIIIRKGELIEFKGDKMPVSYHRRKDVPFSRHEFKLLPNDSLYMFSDGYIDQFGGKNGHKFLMKRFTDLLVKIHKKPMQEQKIILDENLTDWIGNHNQIDDVLVLGFRFAPESEMNKLNWQDKTILIAEDTDINYFLLVEVLKRTNANIIRARDGQEAIEIIKSKQIDLVLMDINMPRMDGFEATKQIKEYNSDIPVIIQTALYQDGQEKALEMGADEFISKPIDLKTFLEKITQVIK